MHPFPSISHSAALLLLSTQASCAVHWRCLCVAVIACASCSCAVYAVLYCIMHHTLMDMALPVLSLLVPVDNWWTTRVTGGSVHLLFLFTVRPTCVGAVNVSVWCSLHRRKE